MTDGTNGGNPNDNTPGWAAPDHQNPGQVPTNPPMPTPPPADSQVPFSQNQPNQVLPPYPSENSQPKKKRKLWLWITLGIVIPLLLCGAGIGGCAYFVVGQTKPAIDVTNDFYKAAKAGKDLDPYTCKAFLDLGGFNTAMDDQAANYGPISSYNFNNVSNNNGVTVVKGTVVRSGVKHSTTVRVTKDNGKSKVCYVDE